MKRKSVKSKESHRTKYFSAEGMACILVLLVIVAGVLVAKAWMSEDVEWREAQAAAEAVNASTMPQYLYIEKRKRDQFIVDILKKASYQIENGSRDRADRYIHQAKELLK